MAQEFSSLHKKLCFTTSPLGRAVHWLSTVIKDPTIEVPVETGATTVKVLCPCCVFYRGLAVGGLLGLLVGLVF